jgi:hypothetical protein
MFSRRIRRVVVLMVLAFAVMVVPAQGASAHPCTTLEPADSQVCVNTGAGVWNPIGLGFCGTGCVEVHSSPSVHTGGESSVTLLGTQIVTVTVPDEDIYLGTFCYTTPGGSC